MGTFRVRAGKAIGHAGTEYRAGAILELPENVARECSELVEPCDAHGNPTTAQAVDTSQIDRELATAQAHERVSLLEAEVGRAKVVLKAAEDRLAAERARTTPTTKAKA